MHDIQQHIQEICDTLVTTFYTLDTWFDLPENIQKFRPDANKWTIAEILEHISLTNHYLLKLIDKGTIKALKNAQNLDVATELENYSFAKEKLDEIGKYQSFPWIRPEHMEPTGKVLLPEVRALLQGQKNRCLAHLQLMPNGEGVLYKTTMSVNNLGKINVYEYIYFLAKHAQRHLTQLETIKAQFRIQATDLK